MRHVHGTPERNLDWITVRESFWVKVRRCLPVGMRTLFAQPCLVQGGSKIGPNSGRRAKLWKVQGLGVGTDWIGWQPYLEDWFWLQNKLWTWLFPLFTILPSTFCLLTVWKTNLQPASMTGPPLEKLFPFRYPSNEFHWKWQLMVCSFECVYQLWSQNLGWTKLLGLQSFLPSSFAWKRMWWRNLIEYLYLFGYPGIGESRPLVQICIH